MRPALLILLFALVIGGFGCTGEDAADMTPPSVTVTTSMETTTLAPSSTSTSPPSTTTSSTSLPEGPMVVTAGFGSLFDIVSVPEMVSAPGLEARLTRARLSGFDYHTENRINGQLDAFLDARRATYVPNPDPSGVPANYALDFEALWLEQEAWPVLSIVYTETARPAGAAEATTRRFALMFDLPTGEPLTVAEMLTPEGVAGLKGLIRERLAETLGDRFCCFEPGKLVANVGVVRDGLRVYVDVPGFPEQNGSLEFAFTWVEVMNLIDMRQRFLARRVVERGGCSVDGDGLALEEQPGLPELVAAKRRAIFAAAVACDFEALGGLVPVDEPDGWFWGFVGVRGGSAEAWQEYEAAGYVPLWFLVRTLNLPYAEVTGWSSEEGWLGYAWPAVAADESDGWAHIPAEERAGLVALYGEDTVAGWDERDFFFGYRVVIRDDGLWWYYGVAVE